MKTYITHLSKQENSILRHAYTISSELGITLYHPRPEEIYIFDKEARMLPNINSFVCGGGTFIN